MTVQFGPRLISFLEEPLPITVGTTRKDGSVQMNPIWFEYRDGQIWLNGGPDRGWLQHVQRDSRVTLLLVDPKSMFRWAQIQCRLADISSEGADDHIEKLSHRYTGGPYRMPKVNRLIVRVDPERVTGGESMQPWDAE